MTIETFAVVCAVLGMVMSVGYLVLGVKGISLLREVRDRLSRP